MAMSIALLILLANTQQTQVITSVGAPVPPVVETTENLLRICSNSSQDSASFCLGVINGAADAIALEAQMRGTEAYCPPEFTSYGQIRGVVLGYIRANPASHRQPGPQTVREALAAAYPCPPRR